VPGGGEVEACGPKVISKHDAIQPRKTMVSLFRYRPCPEKVKVSAKDDWRSVRMCTYRSIMQPCDRVSLDHCGARLAVRRRFMSSVLSLGLRHRLPTWRER